MIRRDILRRFLFIPPVVAGVAILVFFARDDGGPDSEPPRELARPVRVIAVPLVDLTPRARGYGQVRPGRVWEAVAEVSGRIIEKHARLKPGEIVTTGEVLLRIDPADYELAIESTAAGISGAEAQIEELAVRELNSRRALEIETRSLRLAEKDLTRKSALLKRGNISQAAVDETERAVLTRRQSVQGYRGSLDLLPAERAVLRANLARLESELAQARRNLERTTIVAPFDGRVSAVGVEESQFAGAGQVLAALDSLDVAEIAAQIPLDQVRRLFLANRLSGFDVTPENLDTVFEQLGVTAVVRLRTGDLAIEWPARFVRTREAIDPGTRTVGVVVAVDEPYRQAVTGRRPPLARNMYVEVALRGQAIEGSIVIPRSALHAGYVYILNDNNRLERRAVEVGLRQGELVALSGGLAAGERIVVSDLIPAIDGMLLVPVEDAALLEFLIAEAAGEGAAR